MVDIFSLENHIFTQITNMGCMMTRASYLPIWLAKLIMVFTQQQQQQQHHWQI